MYIFLHLNDFDWFTYYVHENFMGTFRLKFPLKCNDKKPVSSILIINLMRIEKFKKTKGVLNNGCSTLAIKFQIQQVIDHPYGNFQFCSSGKRCWG